MVSHYLGQAEGQPRDQPTVISAPPDQLVLPFQQHPTNRPGGTYGTSRPYTFSRDSIARAPQPTPGRSRALKAFPCGNNDMAFDVTRSSTIPSFKPPRGNTGKLFDAARYPPWPGAAPSSSRTHAYEGPGITLGALLGLQSRLGPDLEQLRHHHLHLGFLQPNCEVCSMSSGTAARTITLDPK